jgi:hypothetical protein
MENRMTSDEYPYILACGNNRDLVVSTVAQSPPHVSSPCEAGNMLRDVVKIGTGRVLFFWPR